MILIQSMSKIMSGSQIGTVRKMQAKSRIRFQRGMRKDSAPFSSARSDVNCGLARRNLDGGGVLRSDRLDNSRVRSAKPELAPDSAETNSTIASRGTDESSSLLDKIAPFPDDLPLGCGGVSSARCLAPSLGALRAPTLPGKLPSLVGRQFCRMKPFILML